MVDFGPGQAQAEIPLPALFDHGLPTLTRELTVQLSAPSGALLGDPASGVVVTCQQAIGCGTGFPASPTNPLELPVAPPASNPLGGARFFADGQSAAERAAATLRWRDPRGAALLSGIARQPGVTRFGAWNGPYPGAAVAAFLSRAQGEDPGAVPMLSTYRIVDGHCGGWSDSPAEAAAYHAWITSLAEGIGYHPAVLFLEMDSLITVGCLSPGGLAVRPAELRDAVSVLARVPHLVVYLEAGAADALPAPLAASLLERARVAETEGFFLNLTHFDWTRHEIAYGRRISRLIGGKHFVVNTAENGQGPLVPRHSARLGNEVLCNPPERGLGPLPTAETGFADVDAFAWIAGRLRRPLPPRRPGHGPVLAGARDRAGSPRGLQGSLKRPALRASGTGAGCYPRQAPSIRAATSMSRAAPIAGFSISRAT